MNQVLEDKYSLMFHSQHQAQSLVGALVISCKEMRSFNRVQKITLGLMCLCSIIKASCLS